MPDAEAGAKARGEEAEPKTPQPQQQEGGQSDTRLLRSQYRALRTLIAGIPAMRRLIAFPRETRGIGSGK
jgi:hypothetical protein